jgi:superfamily II helicase
MPVYNTIDAPTSAMDATVKVFDSFYDYNMIVDSTKYEIVRSYFKSVTNSQDIAENFATMLFRIAGITGIEPLNVLTIIQGKSKMEANAIMIYYLNNLKSKTALYGISVVPQPNQNVQRNVVI